ncbi:MAG TPA: mucoidy inhibitor MuiA family protein [Oscillatoriaceae cyanobacterium M33_DOE_052]|uniref:Mucoidy inhibitor MuiA family protein n=1 Tax=Planktothricoides sp. SpSt-374 TaxID=2282167 RepID=A0A7C3VFM7_9CYAN|nr:mucoidy inhibitor MuiA family protein [Oscillatoriaceae cyanobacterium M33_DOE_052]
MTQTAAQPPTEGKQILESRISAVTVYQDRALITRSANLTLTGTEQELIIQGLPLTLETESVRARGSGTVNVRLLGVQTERVFSTAPVEARVAELTEQMRIIEEQKRAITDVLETLNLQRELVKNLGDKYLDRFSAIQPPQNVDLPEIASLLDFIGARDTDYAAQVAQREREQKELEKQLSVLEKQKQKVQQPAYQNSYSSYSIYVAIEPAGSGEFELEISYIVSKASWTPLYDLRTSTTGDRLNLTYLAEIKQKTGEDWQGVPLTLSTAQPAIKTLPNKLLPIYIVGESPSEKNELAGRGTGDYSKEELKRYRHHVTSQFSLPEFDELEAIFEAAEIDLVTPTIPAEEVAATATNTGGTVTFHLDRDSTIPSDDRPHKVTIFNQEYPCRTQHICVPRLSTHAYLEAQIINPSDGATLLAGKANIFRENTLIGNTELENVAPGQTFKLNLGIDESIKIDRVLVERNTEQLGNYRRVTYGYRIKIANLSDRKTQLRLIEQLPVSRNEQIKVRLLRTSPQIELGEMGLLEWNLTLQPKSNRQSTREIYYQSTSEYPTNFRISLL